MYLMRMRAVAAAAVCTWIAVPAWAVPWPAEPLGSAVNLTAVEGPGVNDFYNDLSGACWNPVTRRLWVCRNGPGGTNSKFWALAEDGADGFAVDQRDGNRGEWTGFGDLEGITQADYHEDVVYAIIEGEDRIKEYDVSVYGAAVLNHTWNTNTYMPLSGGSGAEGITFVPDEHLLAADFVDQNGSPYTSQNGMGGLMFVAHQNGGRIYVFDLDRNDGSFSFVGRYLTNYSESCSLEFDRSSGLLYIFHGNNRNTIEVTDLTSVVSGSERKFVALYTYNAVAGGNLEGIAVQGNDDCIGGNRGLFLTIDDGGANALFWFRQFPCTPDCTTDSACDDGLYCNGIETCDDGSCVSGAAPCGDGFCDESADACVECLNDGDCNDGVFCNGVEQCVAGSCQDGADPCPGNRCDESLDACVSCLGDDDCADGLFCNGDETCVAGACQAGAQPCAGGLCDEPGDECVECLTDAHCSDDLYCDGAESCVAGVCVAGPAPCAGQLCDESNAACVDCLIDADCDDGAFCNGAEACVSGACQAGLDPCPGQLCDGETAECVDCLLDATCDDGDPCTLDSCVDGVCRFADDDADDDGDGVPNCTDQCADAPDVDSDGDGALDCADGCPDDADKLAPGVCGCGIAEGNCGGGGGGGGTIIGGGSAGACTSDAGCDDGLFCNGPEECVEGTCAAGMAPCAKGMCDERADTCTQCLSDEECDDGEPCTIDTCADGKCAHDPDLQDQDYDGVPDCSDQCPGTADVDSDGDGVLNCADGCPLDPSKLLPGRCGCGTPESECDAAGQLPWDEVLHPADVGTPRNDMREDTTGEALTQATENNAVPAPTGVCGAGGGLAIVFTLAGLTGLERRRR